MEIKKKLLDIVRDKIRVKHYSILNTRNTRVGYLPTTLNQNEYPNRGTNIGRLRALK